MKRETGDSAYDETMPKRKPAREILVLPVHAQAKLGLATLRKTMRDQQSGPIGRLAAHAEDLPTSSPEATGELLELDVAPLPAHRAGLSGSLNEC